MPARTPTTIGVAVALAGLLLTACTNTQAPAAKGSHAGTGTPTVAAGVQVLTVKTGSDYRFHPSTLVVHPGKVKVILVNTEQNGAPHNLSVQGFPADFVPLAGAGKTTTATFVAPAPGTYEFVCTIHIRQGQTGKLVVKPGRP